MKRAKPVYVTLSCLALVFAVSAGTVPTGGTDNIDSNSSAVGERLLQQKTSVPQGKTVQLPEAMSKNTPCYCDVYYKGFTSTGVTSTAQSYTAMDGATMGSESNNKYLITMGVDIRSLAFDVEYKHWLGSGYNWSSWYLNGSGPPGYTGSPVKGIKIRLVNAPGYHVDYRIRVDGKGWQGWVSDGAEASYHNNVFGYRKITAIQVRLTGPQKTHCSIGGFDNANCYVGTPPSGTNAFIYGNAFYYTPLPGNQCPYLPFPNSRFDGANCYVTDVPPCASPFIYSNSWYVTPTY